MNKILFVLIGLISLSATMVTAFSVPPVQNHFSPGLQETYDLVIITPEVFSASLQLFIDHKNSHGIHTFVQTTEAIYDEYPGRDHPEQIKQFISSAVENWDAQYVLLVGGASQLPTRYVHIYYDYDYQVEWVFPSDVYYADLYDTQGNFSSWDTNENDVFAEYNWGDDHLYDTLDLYPDVSLGRLPCTTEDEVLTCLNKIITYENDKAYTQPWFTNLTVIGGDSLPGDEEHIDEGEYVNEGVIENMEGFLPKKIWASNGLLNDATHIQDAINTGAGFVFFNGHGNLNLWATHPHESYNWIPPGCYTNTHLNSLSNGNKLPIVISDACYHCTYTDDPECFGWTFVKNPNGGCIAFFGSTDIDVSHAGVAIITKGIEKLCILMSQNYIEGDTTVGELWSHGLQSYLATADMDEMDYITVEEFQLFGDPSLIISEHSQPPQKPEPPTGTVSGKINTKYTYTASTTDPDGDNISYLFDWGDDTVSSWLGPFESGESISAEKTWTTKGTYQIRVLAKDSHGILSEWSDPLAVTIPFSKDLTVFSFFELLAHRFPNAFPLIRYILRYPEHSFFFW
jgi:hypothetical protein